MATHAHVISAALTPHCVPVSSARTRRSVVRAASTARCASSAASTSTPPPTRVWHCPPPAEARAATQAASTLSKLPPHTLASGGLDPSSQTAQNQQAYLGSLAERYLPVDLSYRGVRVLNVDPPIFAIADFIPAGECDALAVLASDATAGDVANVKSAALGVKMPAPLGDGMPSLAQRLGELVEDARAFVRCDGAWLQGGMMNSWGMSTGFSKLPPPGAFAFEMPTLNITANGEVSGILPDGMARQAANDLGYQRRALFRVFLTDAPQALIAAAESAEEDSGEPAPDIDRDAFSAKFVICDIGVAPAKGTAIVTFPSFADGMPDERISTMVRATPEAPMVWMDLPVSVGLIAGGIAAPVTMRDMGSVEKVDEEANVGTAARDRNRQEWRANVGAGGLNKDGSGKVDGEETSGGGVSEVEGGGGATEEAMKKLEELKEAGL